MDQTQSPIVYNVADATIITMCDQFMPLRTNGPEDKEALALVRESRLQVKALRVTIGKRRKELKASDLASAKWGTHQAELFDGQTYEPSLDKERLAKQARAVYEIMIDGEWRSLRSIVEACVARDVWPSEAGVSARLRDFRKEAFGSHTVNRRRAEPGQGGHFQYQLIDPKKP